MISDGFEVFHKKANILVLFSCIDFATHLLAVSWYWVCVKSFIPVAALTLERKRVIRRKGEQV
jgi:hypothetical protein